jgi:hypothetical protein
MSQFARMFLALATVALCVFPMTASAWRNDPWWCECQKYTQYVCNKVHGNYDGSSCGVYDGKAAASNFNNMCAQVKKADYGCSDAHCWH